MTDPILNRHSREDGKPDSTSSENLITQHIDIWTTAIERKSSAGRGTSNKFTLYGIKKLRELILELAVRGKLVPQDVNDEPASVLLERIAAEKAQLVKEGKLKKQKPLPEIGEDEKPFELPQGWAWSRLSDLVYLLGDGLHGTPEYSNDGEYHFVNGNNLINGRVVIKPETKKVAQDQFDKFKKNLTKNTVLVSINGTLGNVAFYDNEKIVLGKSACYFNLSDSISKLFIKRLIESPIFIKYAFENASGSTIKNLGLKAMNCFSLGLPSFEEQHRIVAKVDELMSLCDALEAQTEASIAAHQTLVETLLNALLLPNTTLPADSQSASLEPSLIESLADSLEPAFNDSFIDSWQRVAEHFDTLFTTAASIDTLKQTILQLAVMGKLVDQDENDEPAAKLLERIKAAKAQQIKDGKIKKQKPLPAITDEEKPFELPKGWEWCKIQNITSKVTDGDHKTPPRIHSGYRLLSAKNVRDGHLDFENVDFIAESDYLKSRERCLPQTGDLLIVSVGGTIGRSSLVPEDSNFALVRSVALLKPLMFCSEYLKYSMDSQLLQDSIHENKRGGAQPCLYLSEISKFYFPMPPLEEQQRIVAKVDELMALCDQLKARLSDAQTTQLHLTDAIVEQAV
jgi:type I restriction enzyme S subunit